MDQNWCNPRNIFGQ